MVLRYFRLLLIQLFSLFFCVELHSYDWILHAPKENPEGVWGPWENCQRGEFVTGVALKKQTEENEQDEFGISGIELYCGNPGETTLEMIHSSIANEGKWGKNSFPCEGYFKGFQLEIDTNLDKNDYAGVTNLRLFCLGGRGQGYEEESKSLYGEWTEPQICPKGQAICGLQTKMKNPDEHQDLVGINSLKMRCCEIPSQVTKCFPRDNWEIVFEVDNTLGFIPVSYTYSKQIGMATKNGKTSGKKGSIKGKGEQKFEFQYTIKDNVTERNRTLPFIPPIVPRPILFPRPRKESIKITKNHSNNHFARIPNLNKNLNKNSTTAILKKINRQSRKMKKIKNKKVEFSIFNDEAEDYYDESPEWNSQELDNSRLRQGNSSQRPRGRRNRGRDEERFVFFFRQSIDVSKTTGFNWKAASDDTFSPLKATSVDISVAPGHYIAVYQVVGFCGDYFVRAEKFYQNGSFYNPESKRRKFSPYEWRSLSKVSQILENFSSMYEYLHNIGKVFGLV